MSFSKEIQDSYYKTMKKIYGDKFGCNCRHLNSDELYNKELVNEFIDWVDIIYEGGGDTSSMITLWKETGFDKKLYEALEKGKVICGISAGAACWFKHCNSDLDKSMFGVVDCLNWIDAFITPHCDEEGRSESTKEQLKNIESVGILLSNCSAIEIVDDKYRIITENVINRSFSKGYVYKVYWNNGKYFEKKLKEEEFLPLKDLLTKDIYKI